MFLKIDKEKSFQYFTEGPSLFFVKFLHEHKKIIINMIISRKSQIKKKYLVSNLKKLNNYEYSNLSSNDILFIKDLIYETILYHHRSSIEKIDIRKIIEKNMSKEYIFHNFELWWSQSIYMLGGSGYIRNINDYVNKCWITHKSFFSEQECLEKLKLSYSKLSVPKIFSNSEILFLENDLQTSPTPFVSIPLKKYPSGEVSPGFQNL